MIAAILGIVGAILHVIYMTVIVSIAASSY